ncbi:STAS domain-containing protein [Dongshaea marina]|uniref:STAS domain-containing protein n=1 Tax=Dongshaea marina TaxID=2047966 RepID=UPI00131F061F|nr:STAS domain-containing protein [Dongshaea marina]
MLNINAASKEYYSLISLDGALDINSHESFTQQVEAIYSVSNSDIIMDLEKLRYISSVGLRAFVLLFKRLAANNHKLVLYKTQPMVKEVLVVSGFSKLMPIHDDLSEAEKVFCEQIH